ncbi:MAG: hypothetical protein ACHQU1_03110 [Gemmatimonadales bacterium]
MNPKVYSRAVGVVLLLLGAIGLVQNPLMGMDLSKRHSAVHLVTGALLAFVGFTGASESLTKNVVLAFGVVYAALGVCGFFMSPMVPGLRIYYPDPIVNVIHIVVGLAGVAAAMMGGAGAASKTA